MFEKILIVEDFDSYNYAVKTVVEEINIRIADQSYYCDDALLKIRKSYLDQDPYELLITDLSFDNRKIEQRINSGEELIQAVKNEFTEIKIIVFSIENRIHVINSLFEKYKIDGFVTKGRNDIKELKNTIVKVNEGEIIKSVQGNIFEFSEIDLEIVRLLTKKNMNVKEISEYFKKNKITPNSESYLNKRLMHMRKELGAENTLHLLTIFSDLGLLD